MKARRLAEVVGSLASRTLVMLAKTYQATLSPYLGRQCRFTPTCSTYFVQAVQKRGPLRGLAMGLWRIARCNPLCRGGYDPVDRAGSEAGNP